jgi:hypothetical protein
VQSQDTLPLLQLCEAGKLYEVEDWIKAGNRIQFTHSKEKIIKKFRTPLEIAVNNGFYSLAQLLLQSGYNPNLDTCDYLTLAAVNNRSDLVILLLKYGANINGADFEEVLRTYNREIIDLFIEAGANPCKNNALAKSLYYCSRPILGFIKQYKERLPCIQHQINLALYDAAVRNKERAFSLLLWAGAEPFIPVGEYIDCDPNPNDEDEPLSVFEMLCYSSNKRLTNQLLKKPIPNERKEKLFYSIAFLGEPKWTKRFIDLGVDINKDYGDGSVLYVMAGNMGSRFCSYNRDDIKIYLENIELILKAGGKLTLESPDKITYLRRKLCDGTRESIKPLIGLLVKYEAASKESLAILTKTPKIREILGLAEPKTKVRNKTGYYPNSSYRNYFKKNNRYYR